MESEKKKTATIATFRLRVTDTWKGEIESCSTEEEIQKRKIDNYVLNYLTWNSKKRQWSRLFGVCHRRLEGPER